jgi:hypothetical protein
MKYNTSYNLLLLLVKILLIFMFIFLLYIIISKYINNNTNTIYYKETYKDTKTISEDSGNCKTQSDIVDFCVNYNSCCAANSPSKDCLCKHPIVQTCRSDFTNCLSNNPNQLSQNDLMTSCINANKTCCNGYNKNLSIKSSAFTKYGEKNDPVIKPLCSITNVPDMEQKCLELCTTTPKCVAYSLSTGALVSNYGICSLYDTVNYATNQVDKQTGNKIPFLSDYYTRN